MKLLLVLIITLIGVLSDVNCANILFLSGSLSAGHHIWNRVLAKTLSDRGHNVTFVTPERDVADVNGRLHFIHLENVYERIIEKFSNSPFRENHLQSKQPIYRRIKESYRLSSAISAEIFRSSGIRQLLEYPPSFQFDLVIHDSSSSPALLGFWLHFQRPPLVTVSPSTMPLHLWSVAGIPFHPGLMLHPLADFSPYPVVATRVYNTIYYLFDRLYRSFPFMNAQNEMARGLFGDALMGQADLQAIEQMTRLFLVNTSPVTEPSSVLPASTVPVGALQMSRGASIPSSIKQFLDGSKNGVIVFSVGVGLFTPSLTRDEDEVFLEVFRKLYQYDFLWRYDKTEKLECPRNIMMTDWLENQHAILQHPKILLFITNGGPLSVQEAAWAGVPIIGIPLRFDQRQTLERFRRKGVAQLLPLNRLRNDTLTRTIRDTLATTSFKASAMEMAQLLRSHPDSTARPPAERAVDWIEYALASSDLAHLKSPLATVPFQILYSLDIVLAVAFTIIGFCAIVLKHMVFDKMLSQARQQQPAAKETSTETANATRATHSGETKIMGTIPEEEDDHDDVQEDKKNT